MPRTCIVSYVPESICKILTVVEVSINLLGFPVVTWNDVVLTSVTTHCSTECSKWDVTSSLLRPVPTHTCYIEPIPKPVREFPICRQAQTICFAKSDWPVRLRDKGRNLTSASWIPYLFDRKCMRKTRISAVLEMQKTLVCSKTTKRFCTATVVRLLKPVAWIKEIICSVYSLYCKNTHR